MGLTPDGLGWRCHVCDAHGDAVTLAAWVVAQRPSPNDWKPIRDALAGILSAPLAPSPRMSPVSPATLARPPRAELEALWSASLPLDAVPSDLEPSWTGDVRAYLCQRGFDVGWLTTPAARGLARVLPPPERFPFPPWWPYSPEVYRLALLGFAPDGTVATIQARAIRANLPAQDKTRNPRGFSYAGTLFADDHGREFLQAVRGRGPWSELEAVVIAEGLTDTLKLVQVAQHHERSWGVLGMVSGSASAFRALSTWPESVPCWVATDGDDAGDRYASQVREALPPHVTVERVNFTSRQEGSR
ncbi:hypothetical protein F0U62_33755 [Cystobacter fuscus]|uniref:hypothetical protein n=1 Tax=Cystobacter fuscus TaxID=43 RepID=UPI002B2A1BF5|nr:hypothetical protein F0U62_33755 [Cystobacter fuscus]